MFFALILCVSQIIGQSLIERDTSIEVWENGVKFEKAWVGGMNGVQFSEIDLNLDGIMDLITLDRTGNKLNPYTVINGKYVFSPEYRENFPQLHDWVLLEDYDCDGKKDIFT